MSIKLEAIGVQKRFGSLEVLKGIDLEIANGEVVSLLGPSGSGKSTFLRCMNQLEEATGGVIYIDGHLLGRVERKGKLHRLRPRELARQRLGTGMVFQNFNLFLHMSALDNVACAPRLVLGMSAADARNRAADSLKSVGLTDKEGAYPSQLSGGQQQRVAIARALAMEPSLMLFDEPTSALDPELIGEVLSVIRNLANAGMTMLIVTHEIRFAREVSDQIVFMDAGVVVESGPPEHVIDEPQHARTRAFLGRVH
jgi:polar amino acid transport system ATP-binding protein